MSLGRVVGHLIGRCFNPAAVPERLIKGDIGQQMAALNSGRANAPLRGERWNNRYPELGGPRHSRLRYGLNPALVRVRKIVAAWRKTIFCDGTRTYGVRDGNDWQWVSH